MKYAPSALGVGELRNKAGSVVASRNRFGTYLRNRVTPVNPSTNDQATVRAQFQQLSSDWKNLTPAEQLGWTNYGATIVRTDKLGQTYTLTGHEAYVGNNINLFQCGEAPISAAPVSNMPLLEASIAALSIAVGTTTFDVDFLPDPVPAGFHMIIEATSPVSPGVSFFGRSAYRQILVLNPTDAAPADCWAAYTAKFGIPAAGQKISVRLKCVRISTGQAGYSMQESAIVAA